MQNRVEQPTQGAVGGLLDDLGASLLRIVFRRQGTQLVDVHDVVGVLLVGAAKNKLDLVGRHATGLKQCRDGEAVVLDTVFDELDGRLEVVEEAVDLSKASPLSAAVVAYVLRCAGDVWESAYVGKEDGHVTAGSQQLGYFDLFSTDQPDVSSGGAMEQAHARD